MERNLHHGARHLPAWRIFFLGSILWYLLVAVLYGRQIERLPRAYTSNLYENTKDFLLWLPPAFLILLVPFSMLALRPRETGRWLSRAREGDTTLTGRFTVAFLALATLALLVLSRDVFLTIKFVVFLAWMVLTVHSARIVLQRHFSSGLASWGVATATVYGALISLSLVLGLLHWMTPVVVGSLALVTALPGLVALFRGPRVSRRVVRCIDSINPVGAAALAAMWIALAVTFVVALAPELASDSMRRHLPYIQNVALHGGFEPQYLDLMRLMPKAIQGFIAAAYVLGSYAAAKWISWFSVVGLAALVGEEVGRRSGDRNLGIFAAAATLACPAILHLSTTLYIDHVIVFLCVAAFVALFRGFESGARKDLLLAAFIMGGALQTKYTVLIFGIIWGVSLLIHAVRRHGFARGARWSLPVVLFLGATGIPWYAYTFVLTGNPVYPWFDDWFDSPYWLAGASTRFDLGTYSFGDTVVEQLLFPWTMAFEASKLHGGQSDGVLGFQLLALLPFLIVLLARREGRETALFAAGFAGFVGVCAYTAYARYWLPVYPLMLIPLFVALGRTSREARWRLEPYLVPVVAPLVMAVLLIHLPYTATNASWQLYRRDVTEEEFLSRRFSGYPAVAELNEILTDGDKVIANGYGPVFTIDGEAYEILAWRTKIYRLHDFPELRAFLRENDISHWVVDHWFLSEVMHFEKTFDASSNLWLDSRLVAARSTVAVYDVSEPSRTSGYFVLDGHEIEMSLADFDRAAAASISWNEGKPAKSGRASEVTGEGIAIHPRGDVFHAFPVSREASLVRTELELSADSTRGEVTLLMRYEWLDEDLRPVDSLTGRVRVPPSGGVVRFFGAPPETAKQGRIRLLLRSAGGQRLTVRGARWDLLAPVSGSAGQQGEDGFHRSPGSHPGGGGVGEAASGGGP